MSCPLYRSRAECDFSRYWWCPRYDKADGKVPPELRLPPAFIGALLLPACLFPFAWASGRTHWMAPVAFSALFSAGAMLLFSPIINYIQDAYPDTAASALAGESLQAVDSNADSDMLSQRFLQISFWCGYAVGGDPSLPELAGRSRRDIAWRN
jgi:hypothetical protein